jgi:hypothetical protein
MSPISHYDTVVRPVERATAILAQVDPRATQLIARWRPNEWFDGPHVTRLRDHDAPGQHATVEQKSPGWFSKMTIVASQVVSTT